MDRAADLAFEFVVVCSLLQDSPDFFQEVQHNDGLFG